MKLWCHECLRVFSDRMINNYDINVFEKLMEEIMRKEFNLSWEEIAKNKENNLIWVKSCE